MPKCLPFKNRSCKKVFPNTWKFKNNTSKIFPKCSLSFGDECCICLTKKLKTKKCTVCKSGIICHSCQKKLTPEQACKCPVCNSETDVFILQIKDNTSNDKTIKKYRCPQIDCQKYEKCFELLTCNNIFIFVTFIAMSYLLGMIFIVSITGDTKVDPFIAFVVGALMILFTCKCLHFCCCSNGCWIDKD